MPVAGSLRVLGVIPARYASTRLPGKPLAQIHGVPMVVRVAQQVARVRGLEHFVVATDDLRIKAVVTAAGFQAVLTDPLHATGTDRVIEVARYHYPEYDAYLNIQGDEPFIDPEVLDRLLDAFTALARPSIATLVQPLTEPAALTDPARIKVVRTGQGQALYFSRTAIPYQRNLPTDQWLLATQYWQHIGVYLFARQALLEIEQLPQSTLEQAEVLEQLRWLEHGLTIHTVEVEPQHAASVDTPADLAAINAQPLPPIAGSEHAEASGII
jgi:3-deoxy-manno-octulosonate cytidylyltransferase (CMP-KDO synthetase)